MIKISANIVGIDLGNSTLKAVRLQKKGEQYVLARVAVIPSMRDPANPVLPMEEPLAAQIKELATRVKAAGADVHFTVNSPTSAVRYADLPHISLQDIRASLKLNSAQHLRQTFENYTFDACPLDAEAEAAVLARQEKERKSGAAHATGKGKNLVAGVSTPEVMLYFHASRRGGIKPRSLQLTEISLMNCFEAANPEIFHNQMVALLDIGFLSSSLTILEKGKPHLTRKVPIGGKQITEYIAQTTSSDFAKAEAAKLKGEANLGEAVARTCVTLVREVRSSINFVEKNADLPIAKIYLCGASSHSAEVIEALSQDIGTACESWDATTGLIVELPSDQQEIFTQERNAFSSAIGVARTYAASPKPKEAASTVQAEAEAPPAKG